MPATADRKRIVRRTPIALGALCALAITLAQPASAACLRVPDHLRGYELYPGHWVFVCKGAGVDYVRRTRRLITWRAPSPDARGLHPVSYLDVRHVLGHGVNWVSVAVAPTQRRGLQDPETLDIIQDAVASRPAQPRRHPPDIPFPANAGRTARDRLRCTGVWQVPEGDVVAGMTMLLYADGRRHARFGGIDMRQGSRDGLRFVFSEVGRIRMEGSAEFYPDGRGGWHMRCHFGVVEYHYYGRGKHRRSHFAGRRGELNRFH
ncbi:MAG: hypothetical protein ACR2PM_13220 [Hyphomicrobiales bacterium]